MSPWSTIPASYWQAAHHRRHGRLQGPAGVARRVRRHRGDLIPVAIETSRGLLVAVLRTGTRNVFVMNPMVAARYRSQHNVLRKKSDPGEALVLANILRTDMHAHWASV